MQILYDEEGDVLDVFFIDEEHAIAYAGYEVRQGIVVYVTKSFSPIQLTMVNFRRLTQVPAIHFKELKKATCQTAQQAHARHCFFSPLFFSSH